MRERALTTAINANATGHRARWCSPEHPWLAERRTRWREEREEEKGRKGKRKIQQSQSTDSANKPPPAPRLFVGGARISSRATRFTPRRPPPPLPQVRSRQKTTLNQRTAHPPHAKTHQRQLRPPARPQLATPQVPSPAHRSSSATGQNARSPSVGRTRWRATSMRPTESEGRAARRQRG